MTAKWHIDRSPERLVLSRRGEARFDISAQSVFPKCARARLAQQIRQDLWRALRNVRGFSPVISVEHIEGGLNVIAGGEVLSYPYPKDALNARIASVLQDPAKRERWLRHAAVSEAENA